MMIISKKLFKRTKLYTHNTTGDVSLTNISYFHDFMQYILRMFLHLGHFPASCSYVFQYKKSRCVSGPRGAGGGGLLELHN